MRAGLGDLRLMEGVCEDSVTSETGRGSVASTLLTGGSQLPHCGWTSHYTAWVEALVACSPVCIVPEVSWAPGALSRNHPITSALNSWGMETVRKYCLLSLQATKFGCNLLCSDNS